MAELPTPGSRDAVHKPRSRSKSRRRRRRSSSALALRVAIVTILAAIAVLGCTMYVYVGSDGASTTSSGSSPG